MRTSLDSSTQIGWLTALWASSIRCILCFHCRCKVQPGAKVQLCSSSTLLKWARKQTAACFSTQWTNQHSCTLPSTISYNNKKNVFLIVLIDQGCLNVLQRGVDLDKWKCVRANQSACILWTFLVNELFG